MPKKQNQKRSKMKTEGRKTLLDAAKEINALGEKGPRDLASNVDKYVYGAGTFSVRRARDPVKIRQYMERHYRRV